MVGFPYNQVKSWFALMMLLSWAFFGSTAVACMLCSPNPKTTLADKLLQSRTVIMAKERTDKPHFFYPVDVLKGSIDGKDINASIGTAARQGLKQNSDDMVVFRQQFERPDWLYTAYADIGRQKFIRAILEQSTGWQGSSGYIQRIEFFAARLNHSHRIIREQAYLEVGRAPYALIKQIAKTLPRSQIRASLSNPRFIKGHNLYILMLGQSRHPDDIAYIRYIIKEAPANGSNPNLSAWVAAFIETNPKTGVEEIENLYFSNRNRKPYELQKVFIAMSVLGSEGGSRAAPEHVDRRYRIVKSYGTLLENHPQMAGPVAKDLTIWQIRALVERLTEIKANEPTLDPNTKMAITHYLSISRRFPHIETTQ